MQWSLILAAVGAAAIAAIFVVPESAQWWMRALLAIAGVVAGPLLFGLLLFVFFYCQYRFWPVSGYGDKKRRFCHRDWAATHDFTDDGGVLVKLVLKPGRDSDLNAVPELGVKNRGKWIFVSEPQVKYHSKQIWCQLNYVQELHPGGFYEARWFRLDRGKFVEMTREKFQLKNQAFAALTRSGSRSR
jgi:hypothetical protein